MCFREEGGLRKHLFFWVVEISRKYGLQITMRWMGGEKPCNVGLERCVLPVFFFVFWWEQRLCCLQGPLLTALLWRNIQVENRRRPFCRMARTCWNAHHWCKTFCEWFHIHAHCLQTFRWGSHILCQNLMVYSFVGQFLVTTTKCPRHTDFLKKKVEDSSWLFESLVITM